MAGKRYRFYYTQRRGERSSLIDALKAKVWYEGKMLQYIRKHYGLGGNYIDVGAHLGTHSVFFAGPCNAHRVFSFEPQLPLCHCMRQTFRANGMTNIHLFEFGLGTESESRWTMGYGIDFKAEQQEREGAEELLIEPFNDWVPECPTIKLIKIDTSGMEAEALLSLRDIILRDHPVMVVESAKPEELTVVGALLEPAGYERGPVFNASPTYIWECKKWSIAV